MAHLPIDLDEAQEYWDFRQETEAPDAAVYPDKGRSLGDNFPALRGLLATLWRDGDRHSLSLEVAGALAKQGFKRSEAESLIRGVCMDTGDPEMYNRMASVRDTYERAADGRPILAWRGIEERMGPDTFGYFCALLGTTPGHQNREVVPEEADDDPYAIPFRLTQRRSFPSFPMLIKDILPSDPRGSVCYLSGLSQSFKSYLALDWACHISEGLEWQGMGTSQAQVVYVAAEGGYKDILSRLRAWEAHNGTTASNLFTRLSPIQVLNREAVLRAIDKFDKSGEGLDKPRLIILDTLSQCAGSADENSSRDARTIYANCKEFGKAWGATVLIVHHSGKSEGGIMRGSSAFFDDSDAVIQMVRPNWQGGGLDCTMNVRKIKSGKLTIGHQMQAREVRWQEGEERGSDLVLVQMVLHSAFVTVPQLG